MLPAKRLACTAFQTVRRLLATSALRCHLPTRQHRSANPGGQTTLYVCSALLREGRYRQTRTPIRDHAITITWTLRGLELLRSEKPSELSIGPRQAAPRTQRGDSDA